MQHKTLKLFACAAALAGAAALSACHDDHDMAAAPIPSSNQQENFSTFAEAVFKADANSTPVNFDTIDLTYDVNDNPAAFDALLM